ncbi:MAG: PBP1A family penicillin-binding protein [Candidatus Pacebacteria bacterium]|nr:PBP1A family penicillin-binding protein [Candidatus Paceibacterota bacterium]
MPPDFKKTKKQYHFLRNPHPYLKIAFILAGIGLLIVAGILLWIAFTPLPDVNTFIEQQSTASTKIYDRTGKTVLYDLNTNVKRTSVPLASTSPYVQHATIAIEDSNFYQEGAISITAIIRSLYVDITSGAFVEGGSTLTQQVVKNSLLTQRKSVIRKVQEWVLAWKLAQHYSKDQILELYLNSAPYGGNLYGVEAASRAYFGVDANDLDLAQAAYLAALPQSPTYYSPYGNNRAALDTRKNLVLSRMLQLGYITKDQYTQAVGETVSFDPQQDSSIIAPHFVFYIRQYLENKYGADVANQGLTVITTLDTDLQNSAQSIVSQYALSNTKTYNASNASLVAIDPKTGQILAMVGSRNYFDTQIDGAYNAALALRQPGSSFKIFVYTAALEEGYTPNTAIFDLPTQFSTSCSPTDNTNDTPPCYAPSNYDGQFRGPMTFTTALAQSINIPAVKVLYLSGIANVVNLAKSLGISSLGAPSSYGLSLALGAADVSLLEMTDAYAAFANDGVYNPPTGILKITDSNGNVLEQYTPQPKQVVPTDIAREMSSMLSNNTARQPEYPAQNPFYFPGYDVAAKTGTTNDSRDAWTIGYTPNIAVGTWAGNNDNSPMVKNIAGYIVAPMWNAFMQVALAKSPVAYFGEPPAIPDTDPPVLRGIYQVPLSNGTIAIHEILYWVQKNNPLAGAPTNPANDPQYAYWEYPVQQWLSGAGASSLTASSTPTSSTTTVASTTSST